MEVLYPHCAGLDVHKDTVVACARHMANGLVRREVRTFKTTTKELLALSDWLTGEGCSHLAMEATGVYWKPVWHVVSDGDFTLLLANAAHVKNVPGRKTDVNDATWLADLLAHGLIRGSFVPDPQTQEMRELLRTRKQLTRERSRHVQRCLDVRPEDEVRGGHIPGAINIPLASWSGGSPNCPPLWRSSRTAAALGAFCRLKQSRSCASVAFAFGALKTVTRSGKWPGCRSA